MFFRKHKPIDEAEFSDVIERLRAERPEPTPLELDEIKMRAIRQANRRGPATTGASMRRTLVVALATFSLMLTGTGAVIADKKDNESDGKDKGDNGKKKSHQSNAGKKQYSHCKKSNKSNSGDDNDNQGDDNGDDQDCPKPPKSHGSNGNGSHKSHKGHQSNGDDD
jgi:hypothetical protein